MGWVILEKNNCELRMILLKSCPKCVGDLIQVIDIHGDYLDCIQCGYIVNGISASNVYRSPNGMDETEDNQAPKHDLSMQISGFLDGRVEGATSNTIKQQVGLYDGVIDEILSRMVEHGYVSKTTKRNRTSYDLFSIEPKGSTVFVENNAMIAALEKQDDTDRDEETQQFDTYEFVDSYDEPIAFGIYASENSEIFMVVSDMC